MRGPDRADPGSAGRCAGRSGSGSGTDPYAAVLPFYDVTRVDARRGTVRTVPRAAEARARRAGALPLRDSIGRGRMRGVARRGRGARRLRSAAVRAGRVRAVPGRRPPRVPARVPATAPVAPVLALSSVRISRVTNIACDEYRRVTNLRISADTTPRRRAGPRRVAGSVWMRAQSVAALYVLNRAERRAGGFDLFSN